MSYDRTVAMNLNKVSPDEKLNVCRKYFIVGAFALPLVWLVNVIWFTREAFRKSAPRKMKLYVAGSFVGVLAWSAVIAIWVSVYLTQRPSWGAAGDQISFVVPLGIP